MAKAKQTFAKGTLVTLKSGGPQMTVADRPSVVPADIKDSHVLCMWFNHSQELKHLWFDSALLAPAT